MILLQVKKTFVRDAFNEVGTRADDREECEPGPEIWVFAHYFPSIYLEQNSRDARYSQQQDNGGLFTQAAAEQLD